MHFVHYVSNTASIARHVCMYVCMLASLLTAIIQCMCVTDSIISNNGIQLLSSRQDLNPDGRAQSSFYASLDYNHSTTY